MHISTVRAGRRLSFLLTPDEHDPVTSGTARRGGDRVEVLLPEDMPDPHPDLLALAAMLVGGVFIGRTLTLDTPVSAEFAAAEKALSGRTVGPVGDVAPRVAPADGRPALCFSGGVDSTAALAVLPPETELFFLDRIPPADRETRSEYRKDAALAACAAARADGRTVHEIQTDVEYLREPVGFPLDLSNALPAVLLADFRGIDAISWGTIAESAYKVGGKFYLDYAERPAYARFNALFSAAGLPFLNAVAGVSEVGTSLIVRRSEGAVVAQSCMRGGVGAPCRSCWKCFRKLLLDSALSGRWPDDAELDRLFSLREPVMYLRKVPVKHEDVITYLTSKYTGSHPMMRALRRRVGGDRVNVDWLTRHYRPALDLVPAKYRAVVEERLGTYLEPMTPAEEEEFRSWIPASLRPDEDQGERIAEFDRLANATVLAGARGDEGSLTRARRLGWHARNRVKRRLRSFLAPRS
jgi:hypothetical protein